MPYVCRTVIVARHQPQQPSLRVQVNVYQYLAGEVAGHLHLAHAHQVIIAVILARVILVVVQMDVCIYMRDLVNV